PDVVVDAIYGTGFHGRLREKGANAAAEIADAKAAGAKVFALDIPSGMGGDLEDESELDERCVRADVTITFHAKKKVHLQSFAAIYCGQIITADIGIVDDARDASGEVDTACERDADGTVTAAELAAKDVYTFRDFVDIVAQLRAPDGCVWDRAQTHETLTKYMTEEAQEAVEAMLKEDDENLCEELGDVLLQVVLNAQIGAEENAFTIDDVIQGISEKMIRRHPWVFGDMDVSSIDENVSLWEQIKQKEKEAKKK
ncbi:MAG: MazG family protein, partial [Clostridiales bacterium]|nr:MazG family protein [Clostridiales bacterium]